MDHFLMRRLHSEYRLDHVWCNCSADDSFSKMELIKNRLRTSMSYDDELSHVSLMSIEVSILRQINFEDLVTGFS